MTTRVKQDEAAKPASYYRNNKLLPLDANGDLILGNTKAPPVDEKLAKAVLDILDAGLSNGLGEPAAPGNMCVEAAVSAAMGMDTRDGPICVNPGLRALKININDNDQMFNDEKDRAMALRRIAIAQLGTQNTKFVKVNGKWDTVPTKKQTFNWGKFQELLRNRMDAMTAALIEKQKKSINHSFDKDQQQLYDAVMKATRDDDSYRADELRDEMHRYLRIDDEEFFQETYSNARGFTDFMDSFIPVATEAELYKNENEARDAMIEEIVQVLIIMKTPGSKFLYLTEGKAARKSKSSRKRA
jgi:hypothetical protein